MKSTELIVQDHMTLRRGLDILDRMVQVMENGDRIEIFDIRTVLRFLQIFINEHGEERELFATIEADLKSKHGVGFVRSSRRLIPLLRNSAGPLLSREKDPVVASELTANFARLERKYAPKTRGTSIALDRRAHA